MKLILYLDFNYNDHSVNLGNIKPRLLVNKRGLCKVAEHGFHTTQSTHKAFKKQI